MSSIEAELRALREEVDRLKAKDQITQQLTRYGRAQEWLDESLLNDVFYEDADIDFGFFVGKFKDYRPILMEIERSSETTFHLCAAPQIDLRGDTAYVECYGIAGGRNKGETNVFGGRYVDVFKRRDGVWKIASRKYVLDWHMGQKATNKDERPHPELEVVTDRSPRHPLFRRMGIEVD